MRELDDAFEERGGGERVCDESVLRGCAWRVCKKGCVRKGVHGKGVLCINLAMVSKVTS